MKRTLVSFYFCSLLLAFSAPAQKAPSRPPPGDRFLFVVDTSFSMKRLDAANRQTLFDLIYFGLNGHMQPGDTYGIWTFDEEIYTRDFPMQVWDPKKNLELASQAATFLKSRRYRGETRTEPTMAKIGSLVRGVEDVNIFIISDGDAALTGPSIAETVNASYKTRAGEQRRAKKPFITTLVARKGVVISGAVTIAGEPLQLPERAASVSTAQTGATRSLQPTTQAKPAAAPIIIQSKARASLTNATGAPLADVETLKQSSVFQTNAAPPAELFVANELKQPNSSPTNASSSPPQSEAIQIAPASLETVVATTEASKFEAASSPAIAEKKAALAPKQKPETLPQSSPRVEDSKAAVPSAAASAPPPSPSSLPALSPTPMTVFAREPSSTNLATTKPELTLAAAVVTAEPILGPGTMVLIGGALFVSAFGLVFFAVKRHRSAPQSSFISRSMDRR